MKLPFRTWLSRFLYHDDSVTFSYQLHHKVNKDHLFGTLSGVLKKPSISDRILIIVGDLIKKHEVEPFTLIYHSGKKTSKLIEAMKCNLGFLYLDHNRQPRLHYGQTENNTEVLCEEKRIYIWSKDNFTIQMNNHCKAYIRLNSDSPFKLGLILKELTVYAIIPDFIW